MCLTKKTNCKYCNKKLIHNNKTGFCLGCVPKNEIYKLFNKGMTITQISQIVFKSDYGYYRGVIRKILKNHFNDDYEIILKNNKSKSIIKANREKLPLDFIKILFSQGKLSTQIHKALISKGYNLHLATLRNILSEMELDYVSNYKNWLKGRSKTSLKKKKLIKELWINGNSIKEISKSVDLAPLTVTQYLHKLGYKTKLLQYYYSGPSNSEEKIALDNLEKKGYEVKKCLFLCQRNIGIPFNDLFTTNEIPFPKKLKEFCKNCPIKELNFEEQELYDFVTRKDDKYEVVEVKKIYNDPYRRAHFTLGQFINLPKIIKEGIGFRLILFDGDKIHEKRF